MRSIPYKTISGWLNISKWRHGQRYVRRILPCSYRKCKPGDVTVGHIFIVERFYKRVPQHYLTLVRQDAQWIA